MTTSLRDLGKWMCNPWDQKTLSTGQNFQFLPIWSVIYSNALEFSAVIMFTNFHAKIYDFSLSLVVVMLLKNATVAVLIAGATLVRRSRPRPC